MPPTALRALIKRAVDAKTQPSTPGAKPQAAGLGSISSSAASAPASSSPALFTWKPAAPAAPLTQPSFVGRALGYTPSTTPRAQIGRWYENAGGLNRAVASAQNAMQTRKPGVLNSNTWPTWDAARVDRSFSITPRDFKDAPTYGNYIPDSNVVNMSNSLSRDNYQPTLEHELTHGILLPDQNTLTRSRVSAGVQKQPAPASAAENANWRAPELAEQLGEKQFDRPSSAKYRQYLLDPAETDVRLAEIKRQYAHLTGKLIETPEQAQEAWDWFRQNNVMLSPDMSLDGDDFKLYDALPDEQKMQMFHRMPELVQNTQGQYKYSAHLSPYAFGQKLASAARESFQPKRKNPPATNYTPYVLSALAAGIPAALLAGKLLRSGSNAMADTQAFY